MNVTLIAFLVSLSAGVWVYTKLNQRTGYGNNSGAVKGAVMSALIVFLVVLTVGWMIAK